MARPRNEHSEHNQSSCTFELVVSWRPCPHLTLAWCLRHLFLLILMFLNQSLPNQSERLLKQLVSYRPNTSCMVVTSARFRWILGTGCLETKMETTSLSPVLTQLLWEKGSPPPRSDWPRPLVPISTRRQLLASGSLRRVRRLELRVERRVEAMLRSFLWRSLIST